MMPSRGMGDINPSKMPTAKTITRKDDPNKVKVFKAGGKSRVNEAGNYTKPGLRKSIFERIKAGGKGGAQGNGAPARHKCWLSSTKNLEEVIVIEHTETCPVYDNGPCDCGVDEHMTDEQIDFELFEKEAAKD
jgi:hypothetical protein